MEEREYLEHYEQRLEALVASLQGSEGRLMDIRQALHKIADGRDLTGEEMRSSLKITVTLAVPPRCSGP